jgi:lysophospholipase L1-like esterase
MSRTILFFGDSDTRGYGVGRQERFAGRVEAALAGQGNGWKCEVAHAPSDFRAFATRLEPALAKHAPEILVWQCPTGPAGYLVRYPKWILRIGALHNRGFDWWRERNIDADVRDGGGERSRKEAVYEGRYLDRVYRRRPSRWFGVRQLRRLIVAHYGTAVKATRERYLELAARAREQLRGHTSVPILFLGLFPLDDEYFPGYLARAKEWNRHLPEVLHQPERGFHFIDVLRILEAGWDGVVLADGQHLTAEGHRRVAALILPTIERLTLDVRGAGPP